MTMQDDAKLAEMMRDIERTVDDYKNPQRMNRMDISVLRQAAKCARDTGSLPDTAAHHFERIANKLERYVGVEPPPAPEELVIIADLNVVPPSFVARFMAALDRYHRALGGSGLHIKSTK